MEPWYRVVTARPAARFPLILNLLQDAPAARRPVFRSS